jgi:hypothetical protein
MFLRKFHEIAGITLVELLIAMALSGIVLAMIAGLYLFSNKSILNFQDKSAINDQKILIESSLAKEATAIENVYSVNDNIITYSRCTGTSGFIELTDNGGILINGTPVLADDFKAESFGIMLYSRKKSGSEFETDSNFSIEPLEDTNGNFEFDESELKLVDIIEFRYTLKFRKISETSRQLFLLRSRL